MLKQQIYLIENAANKNEWKDNHKETGSKRCAYLYVNVTLNFVHFPQHGGYEWGFPGTDLSYHGDQLTLPHPQVYPGQSQKKYVI